MDRPVLCRPGQVVVGGPGRGSASPQLTARDARPCVTPGRPCSRSTGHAWCLMAKDHFAYIVGYPTALSEMYSGPSVVLQWRQLHAPSSGRLGSIPGQGTRSHVLQPKVLHAAVKIRDPTHCSWGPVSQRKMEFTPASVALFICVLPSPPLDEGGCH